LVENIIKLNKIIVGKLFADDGTYDGNEVLNIWDTMDMPCIKVRDNVYLTEK
jgi:hypothetical protein